MTYVIKEGFCFACVSYGKSVQHRSTKSIQDTDHSSVAGNENLFPVAAEFDASPFTDTTEPRLKGGKGPL